ncbi:MAG: nucleotidyl transferase AbiEii/AbiGii toxin family protein [Deltaproteobacteria bacterium]|nr:nucleotidyl transferase AbiEii/AbiGii toxin family protein [Deltaproteobacteria bacterium]
MDAPRFVHEHEDFAALVDGAARHVGIAVALVEKDYWVTHTLWALQQSGLEIWFKGGTSLSKGFGLIERFSEDLDLKVTAGSAEGIHDPSSWKSKKKGAIAARKAFFEAIAAFVDVPGCRLELDDFAPEDMALTAEIRVVVPSGVVAALAYPNRPYVLLELGTARVDPAVQRDLTSWVHDHLHRLQLAAHFLDNRPRAVRCLHPWVTAMEKLDAIKRRWGREEFEPAGFVRHFDDLASIIRRTSSDDLPPSFDSLTALAAAVGVALDATHPAFNQDADIERHALLQQAYDAIGPMFWGARPTLNETLAELRRWLGHFDGASVGSAHSSP